MNSGELISEGFNLMLLGMGTVFVFLTILVFVTTLMSSLVQKYAPAKPAESKTSGQLNDQTLLAVISAAIHAHRNKK
ncbi:OadG family transporter subunit [Gammaproteobacteria bacterium]|nr:OadG family transporter subunit [Gammaproteobacteria bacterium]